MTARRTAHRGTRDFYDGISGAYDLIADSSEHAARDLGLRALGVSSGQRVLEVGCGTGHALVGLAGDVGPTGHVYGVDLSSGMVTVAQRRIDSSGLRNVTVMIGDARVLCFRSSVFDAVFMSFTLELFERGMPDVIVEVRRVLRVGGRLGIVAMSDTEETNAMIELYAWLHRRWPQFIDCRPIDVVHALQAGHFRISTTHATTVWSLPVVAAVGIKASTGSPNGSSS
jgi:ubiquinone/menaquinone biosynthesis C-methylase UbiE